jgi:hypothetical protein
MSDSTANVSQEIYELIQGCRGDYERFNRVILGRSKPDEFGNYGYWPRQVEICESVRDHPVTLVPTGNAVGKSFVDAGLIHGFLFTHPGSLVIATAPTQVQLEEVLWKEVERSYRGSRIPLGGRLLRSPLKVDLGEGWQALAYSTTKTERLSGHHAEDLFAVTDEASGVEDEIKEALDSLNPSRFLATGNPLRPGGWFYDACTNAPGNPLANLIQISSLESPHIGLPRSKWGLADATWLQKAKYDYGEGSLWWKCHVLGEFPDSGADSVFDLRWIEAAFHTLHQPGGTPRTSIDLGLGNGGDNSVVITRDDNGVLACEASNLWSLETTAHKAAMQVQRFKVAPTNVSWDAEGIGADFDNRLRSVGIHGAKAYRGGGAGNSKFTNLRTAAAWACRHRLDPDRLKILAGGLQVPQVPFSLAAVTGRSKTLLQQELRELRYTLESGNKTALEKAEDYAKRIKRSPDHQASFCQLWGFDRAA